MIRRDYILRMIEEFMEFLERLEALKGDRQWRDADAAVDEEFRRLMGTDGRGVLQLSEAELIAKVVEGESTQLVRHKTLLVTTLLKEAGDVAVAQDRENEGREFYIRGLHTLLEVFTRDDVDEYPEFVPKVEVFISALEDSPMPPATRALLMQHYERTGQFGKAEDALYGLLDALPGNADALDFGIAFYRRLEGQADAALAAGNLPRAELEAGLGELQKRRRAARSGSATIN